MKNKDTKLKNEKLKGSKENNVLPTGWICPVCHAGISPWVTQCPCRVYYPYTYPYDDPYNPARPANPNVIYVTDRDSQPVGIFWSKSSISGRPYPLE